MLMQLKKNLSVKTKSHKKLSNSRILKKDVICMLRILHRRQLKKTLEIYFLVLGKLNHLRPFINRIIELLTHLSASKHQIQLLRLKMLIYT